MRKSKVKIILICSIPKAKGAYMKKIISLLLSVIMAVSLCACGHKDEEELPPGLDNIIWDENQSGQNGQNQSEEAAEPTPVVLPPIDPNSDYFRGTWIDISGGSVSDTLDHYYESDKNYMTLAGNGTGTLVLGGGYRDLTWTQDGKTLKVTFPATGETCIISILSDIIYELSYTASGKDVSLTFIKIVEEK